MSEFVAAINKFRMKTEVVTTRVFQESCRDVSINIADKSPVSTGTLLGKWAPSVGSQSSYNFKGGQSAWGKVAGGYQKTDSIAMGNKISAMNNLMPRILNTTGALPKNSPYYFTNNTSYIQNAEHEGWRGTGPYHMIENGVLGWKQVVYNVAARVKSV